MLRRVLPAALVTLATVAVYLAWSPGYLGKAAAPSHKVVIPGIARDVSSPPTGSGDRQVVVMVELNVLEPAFVGGGVTTVNIIATAHGPLPGQFDPPVTVTGTVTITPHPSDVCGWNPVVVNPNFTMTYSQPQGSTLSLRVNFDGPEWHYQVTCPGGVTIRFPAGNVNESLTGWLGLIFPGIGGPAGAVIDTPVFSGDPDCIKRSGLESNSNSFGAGVVRIWVTQPPCLLP